MRWKNDRDRDANYNMATDEWDKEILAFVEALGDWLEDGEEYVSFRPEKALSTQLHPDQIGQGLVLFLSEWDEDSESIVVDQMSGNELAIVAAHMQAFLDWKAQMAAQLGHKGEADETLEDATS